MLLIDCPWCGPRDECEFSYGGEAHIKRPENPDIHIKTAGKELKESLEELIEQVMKKLK